MARDKFVDDGYDPNEVYAGGAKDTDGHSTNIRAHIPDPWTGVISQLIASSDWPEYKTAQHFYRDAIYHRMRWASKVRNRSDSPRIRTLMAQAQADAALQYRMSMQRSHKAIVDLMSETMGEARANNDFMGMKETLKEIESLLDKMDEPWRSKLASELADWERRAH